MDLEQLLKRVEWLDEERRKDKNTIAVLDDRVLAFDGRLAAANDSIKEVTGDLAHLTTVIGRLDQFDESLAQHRVEFRRLLEDLEKQFQRRDEEADKMIQVRIRGIEENLFEFRRGLDPIPEMQRELRGRVEEENRLVRLIDENAKSLGDLRRSEEELNRIYRLIEDSRRQDTKRLADLHSEVTTIRRRGDEQRGRIDLIDANLRKVATRLNELLTIESERRDAQNEFLEKQALREVERGRVWNEWRARFEMIEKQTTDVERQLLALDTTHSVIKRTQKAVEDLADRVERRINEIMEMQRLAEERFRQEWATFRADDQKRWTNYTLTQDEQRREQRRQFDRVVDRVTILEDGSQDVQDVINQMISQTEKRLQSLLALTHEWVTAYEKTIGIIR